MPEGQSDRLPLREVFCICEVANLKQRKDGAAGLRGFDAKRIRRKPLSAKETRNLQSKKPRKDYNSRCWAEPYKPERYADITIRRQ